MPPYGYGWYEEPSVWTTENITNPLDSESLESIKVLIYYSYILE
jgi:hypothetical protein